MADLAAQTPDAVVAACEAGSAEAAQSLSRALDATMTALQCGEGISLDVSALPAELGEGGLTVLMTAAADSAAVLLIPQSTKLVPDWAADPDPTGRSKLDTLAQELGILLLPEDILCEEFTAAAVDSLQDAVRRGEPGDRAQLLPIQLAMEGGFATSYLVWPLQKPAELFGESQANEEETGAPEEAAIPPGEPPVESAGQPASGSPQSVQQRPAIARHTTHSAHSSLRELPPYGRSLLKIKVPVTVTLARNKQPVKEIMKLSPGSILQFDKSCEETLDLECGSHRIAEGEAVKCGDKFGLRITSMVLPDERFQPVQGKRG